MSSEGSHYTSVRLLSYTTCTNIHGSKLFLLLFEKYFTEKDSTAHCFAFLSSLVFHCCVYTKKYVNTREILYISLGRERKKVGWKRKNNNFCLHIDKNWGISMASLLNIYIAFTHQQSSHSITFFISQKIFFVSFCVINKQFSSIVLSVLDLRTLISFLVLLLCFWFFINE